MQRDSLLLSIRPEYACKVFDGTKTVELRRVKPRVGKGDKVLVYVSAPVKAFVGGFQVCEIIHGPPKQLWKEIKHEAGITREEFNTYYEGTATAFGIVVDCPWELKQPVPLENLRQHFSRFHPPQSYRYLCHAEMQELLSLA